MAAEGTQVPLFDGSQEYLLWVGCSGALQERNVKVTKATARLLLEAGVSFGVLGYEEGCSGDPARRLGNEYLYQMQAQANIDVFKAKGVQKVLTMCPPCFNTMRHDSPPRWRIPWRCRAAGGGRSAAAPAAATCGWRRAAVSVSTTCERRRRRRR